MKKFKISCSQIGKIMGGKIGLSEKQELELSAYLKRESDHKKGALDDKGKPVKALTALQNEKKEDLKKRKENPELPQGAKTYAENWLKEQLYKRRKDFSSKETEKGILVEDAAIDYGVEILGLGFAAKNQERFTQDPDIEGEPDVILSEVIQDYKSSWDCFTFPLFDDKIDSDYYYQGQGYMEITGKKKFELVYCLMDMPEEMIENEVRKASYMRQFEHSSYDEVYEYMQRKYCYSGLPDYLRIKKYNVDYDASVIKEIRKRVKMIRAYIKNELLSKIDKSVLKELAKYSKAA